jgi:hypothetical protein
VISVFSHFSMTSLGCTVQGRDPLLLSFALTLSRFVEPGHVLIGGRVCRVIEIPSQDGFTFLFTLTTRPTKDHLN